MKRMILLLGATGLFLQAAQAAPTRVRCTVDAVIPANAMFGGFGTAPTKGETIDLDLKADELTDLTFSDGGMIELKKANAKLTRKVAGRDYFEGTHRSRTSDYIGILDIRHGEKASHGYIQVLRKKFNAEVSLSQLNLKCEPLS